jgi:succinoglycan biosynthesis transport protein ExoP
MIEAGRIERESAPTWFFNHLPIILRQRRYYLLASFLLLFTAGIVTAFALPTTYRSAATLLVQAQDLPTSLVEAPEVGAVDQRIARIREQVLSRGNLISIIEQNDLYSTERRSEPMSKIIDTMRRATTVSALAGDIGQQSGSQSNTIAIAMSFDYPDPGKAQAVLQSFVSKFLSMDTENVEDEATLSVRFLQDQANKLQAQIAQYESQLTALKTANGATLATSAAPTLIDTGSFSAQIAALQNDNRQLRAQSQNPAQRGGGLAAAEAQLAAAQAQYSDTHPDVIQARERVEMLRRMSRGASSDGDSYQQQIAANNVAIQSLIAQRDSALSRANAAMAGQARAPAVLEQAAQIENRAATLRSQYQQVSENLLKAQNSSRMALEQRAERLTLVEPASLPDRPHSPNRPLLIIGAAAAGLLLGPLLVLILEFATKPIRSPRQLEQMGLPVIGVVPMMNSRSKL